jgi:S1-C subfamily serine protease
MSAVTTCVLGWLVLSPVAGPVPADPPPDPLGRGYLGATFDTNTESKQLVISSVEPGYPAAKAGLRPGDEVVRVGLLEPRTFQELVTHLCSYRPGASVEVEVVRDGKRKVFTVTLAARPSKADPVPIPPMPFRPDD